MWKSVLCQFSYLLLVLLFSNMFDEKDMALKSVVLFSK